jgi:Ca-activated chloride channel family protein
VKLGVVAFSGDAQVVQSPTKDHDLVIAAINRLKPQRATAIGRGMLASLDAIFEDSEETPPSVIALRRLSGDPTGPTPPPVPKGADRTATIVLLSDGQNNQFPAPQQVIEDAVNRGIRIYTVGVGSADGTVVRIQGRSVRTRLDEATLKQIADATGAQYYNASNEKDLRAVYENLTTQLVLRQQRTEVTAILTAIAALLSIAAAALSLVWFNRIP